jgi:truncated hemoglobin YjbI
VDYVHAGMGITDSEFRAFTKHLSDAFEKHKVQKEERGEIMLRIELAKRFIVEEKRSLWDRLGGEEKVRAIVHEWLEAAIKDPKLNLYRGAKFKPDQATTEKQVVLFLSQLTGGPLKYEGRDMKKVHAGMKITEAEFNALTGHLAVVMKGNGYPPAYVDELVAKLSTTKPDIVDK